MLERKLLAGEDLASLKSQGTALWVLALADTPGLGIALSKVTEFPSIQNLAIDRALTLIELRCQLMDTMGLTIQVVGRDVFNHLFQLAPIASTECLFVYGLDLEDLPFVLGTGDHQWAILHRWISYLALEHTPTDPWTTAYSIVLDLKLDAEFSYQLMHHLRQELRYKYVTRH